MANEQQGGNATPTGDDEERGNSGVGKEPHEGMTQSADPGATLTGGDATGSKAEKDARAFDHPGRPGPPG
jgi:hypothetical protein